MRMTGVRPEVGAPLIHLPLSANFFLQFFAFRGAHFWVLPLHGIFGALFSEKNEV